MSEYHVHLYQIPATGPGPGGPGPAANPGRESRESSAGGGARFLACRRVHPGGRLRKASSALLLEKLRDGTLSHPTGSLHLSIQDDLHPEEAGVEGTGSSLIAGHRVSLEDPTGSRAARTFSTADLYRQDAEVAAQTLRHNLALPEQVVDGGDLGFVVVRVKSPHPAARFVPTVRCDLPALAFPPESRMEPRGEPDPGHPYQVIVHEEALSAAFQACRESPQHEISLVPVGRVYWCEKRRHPFLVVEDFLFGAVGTAVRVEVSAPRLAEIRRDLQVEGRGRMIPGTFHSHVLGGVSAEEPPGTPVDPEDPPAETLAGPGDHVIERITHPTFARIGSPNRSFASPQDMVWFSSHPLVSAHFVADLRHGELELGTFGFDAAGSLVRMSGFFVINRSAMGGING